MSFRGELFGFQHEAFKRMLDQERLLLAFEMGLGKTVVTIAAVEDLLDSARISTALVVCPASLKYQWRRMIGQFTDDATVVLVEGTPARRARQYSELASGEPDYGILNYEQVVNDWQYVRHLPAECVVCDEVQAIKSFSAKRARRVKRMRSRYRYGLTGQPVENRPEEVYSIMQWVDPDLLGTFEIFDRTFIVRNPFGGVSRYRNLPTLHRRLGTVMERKRRDDPDVKDQLPAVLEELVPVDFDAAGARVYRHIVRDLLTELAQARQRYGSFDVFRHYGVGGDPDENEARGRIMSRLTALRMLCDSPEVLRSSAEIYRARLGGAPHGQAGQGTARQGSEYAYELAQAGWLRKLGPAPKFDATLELVGDIVNAGRKVVVFSFFKESLRRLREAMPQHRPVLFTGDLSPRERDAAKQKFANDPRCRVFLSSDAGGVGLDLPEASYLINYNLPWSAGKFDQRQARIIRLSSEWESVTLATVLMRGSVEERIHGLLAQKRAVAAAVVDGRGIDRRGQLRLNLATLTDFLTSSEV